MVSVQVPEEPLRHKDQDNPSHRLIGHLACPLRTTLFVERYGIKVT